MSITAKKINKLEIGDTLSLGNDFYGYSYRTVTSVNKLHPKSSIYRIETIDANGVKVPFSGGSNTSFNVVIEARLNNA